MAEERALWEAEFNPRVTTYRLLSGALVLTITIFGILLLPIWFLVGGYVTRRYLSTYRCTLTNRSLKVGKGWLVKVEKTVPLDRITDLGLMQGPIMRLFDIEALTIETAGQSSNGALVSLTGIKDGRNFRDAVLQQRDQVVGSEEDRQATAVTPLSKDADQNTQLLGEIRDTLARIETKIGNSKP